MDILSFIIKLLLLLNKILRSKLVCRFFDSFFFVLKYFSLRAYYVGEENYQYHRSYQF